MAEKHYVSKASCRQKGLLAFLAQDAGQRVFCYANAEIRKSDQNDEILAFVEFWRARTGKLPEDLIFDSKLTTYANLDVLNKMGGISFITLRRRGPSGLIDTYARRMLIENSISDGVDFFHIDTLSSVVAMKVNCDLQLTLMGSSLYRLLGARIGGGYATAESRHICRDFVQAPAQVTITSDAAEVKFGKRAHNPYLLAAGFGDSDVAVPWWQGRRLKLVFG